MAKEIIYCIPGLGCDHRLFSKLNIPEAQLEFLDWNDHKEGEKISAYALRLAEKIDAKKFSLLGVSLGGIVALEIAKKKKVDHLYLISTIKNKNEMPTHLKWMDKLPSKKSGIAKFAMELGVLLKPFYDHADKKGNELFNQMIKASNPEFINWGLKEIAKWDNEHPITTPHIHLHGTDDLVFPIKNIDQAITIKGGSHYMIYNDAEKISKIISELLSKK